MGNGDRKVEVGGSVSETSIYQGDIIGSTIVADSDLSNSPITATAGPISVNKNYLDRMPTEYAESLKQFSDILNKQIQQERIPSENSASLRQSIDKLAKVTADSNLQEGVNENKKRSIRDRVVAVGEALARLSPKIAQAVVGFTPLAPFSTLIGEGVENIIQSAM